MSLNRWLIITAVIGCCLCVEMARAESQSVAGQWRYRLDPQKVGEKEGWFAKEWPPAKGMLAMLQKLPDWVKEGKPSPTGRITFTVFHHWGKDHQPLPSGLLGPVSIQAEAQAPVADQ
jgi:hypothetical protein